MPNYVFRCPQDGDTDLFAPLGKAPKSPHCPTCNRAMRRVYRMPSIAAAALPNKNAGVLAIDRTEAGWSKDMPAYSRLRREGLQPKGIDGAARLEAHANTQTELAMGRLMPEAKVREGVERSSEILGKEVAV